MAMALYLASMFLFAVIFNVDLINIEFTIKFYATSVLGKIVLTVFTIFILVAFKMQSVMKPMSKGLIKGFVLGWFFIFGGILLFFGNLDLSRIGSIEQGKWLLLLFLAIETLLAGISEEFLCRGFLYNIIFNRFKNVKKTVFISSFIFGIIHLINLIHQPIISTLVQVVYAFAFGVLFAAIYVRCKNIWVVVLLHGFWNFCVSAAPQVLTPPDVIAENGIAAQIPLFVLSAFTVCLGLFLIRKKKITDIT